MRKNRSKCQHTRLKPSRAACQARGPLASTSSRRQRLPARRRVTGRPACLRRASAGARARAGVVRGGAVAGQPVWHDPQQRQWQGAALARAVRLTTVMALRHWASAGCQAVDRSHTACATFRTCLLRRHHRHACTFSHSDIDSAAQPPSGITRGRTSDWLSQLMRNRHRQMPELLADSTCKRH